MKDRVSAVAALGMTVMLASASDHAAGSYDVFVIQDDRKIRPLNVSVRGLGDRSLVFGGLRLPLGLTVSAEGEDGREKQQYGSSGASDGLTERVFGKLFCRLRRSDLLAQVIIIVWGTVAFGCAALSGLFMAEKPKFSVAIGAIGLAILIGLLLGVFLVNC